jgi:hypothetical protein
MAISRKVITPVVMGIIIGIVASVYYAGVVNTTFQAQEPEVVVEETRLKQLRRQLNEKNAQCEREGSNARCLEEANQLRQDIAKETVDQLKKFSGQDEEG